ncbi:hypothetical protein ACJIZ3_009450 [Penstemon smallii]|uniref:Dirigent protein n=1 Tax=Penstemon smallii TaxID=265156 RepID=A0ABD3TCJ1_9LAMI
MARASTTPLPAHEWLENVKLEKGEILTELHFFVQNQVSGPNQSVYNVAESAITSSSPTKFGRTQVVDHLITTNPEYNSPKVGRIQGIQILDDLHETALTVNWNIIFTDGPYKGSTLTLLGRLVAETRDGELSIVAGSGKFLLARGIAVKRTISTDPKTSNTVLEYHLHVSTPKAA